MKRKGRIKEIIQAIMAVEGLIAPFSPWESLGETSYSFRLQETSNLIFLAILYGFLSIFTILPLAKLDRLQIEKRRLFNRLVVVVEVASILCINLFIKENVNLVDSDQVAWTDLNTLYLSIMLMLALWTTVAIRADAERQEERFERAKAGLSAFKDIAKESAGKDKNSIE